MMDLDENSSEIDMGTNSRNSDGKEVLDSKLASQGELEKCGKCLELEKKSKELEGKLADIEVQKIVIEVELQMLKKKNEQLEEQVTHCGKFSKLCGEGAKGMEGIVDLTSEEEDDEVMQLKIENKVLDCEKRNAENDAKSWKSKYEELQKRLAAGEFGTFDHSFVAGKILPIKEEMGSLNNSDSKPKFQNASGTPPLNTPGEESRHADDSSKRGTLSEATSAHGRKARKHLEFTEGSPKQKMAPCTPGGVAPPTSIIDIDDSDDDSNTNEHHGHDPDSQVGKMAFDPRGCSGNTLDNTLARIPVVPDDDTLVGFAKNVRAVATPKRKRASNVVASDSESDDDGIPISKLKTKHIQEQDTDSFLENDVMTSLDLEDEVTEPGTQRRLMTLRKCEEKRSSKRSNTKSAHVNRIGISTTESAEEDKDEEEGESESEGESLDGFIVSGSDVSENEDASNGSDGSESYNETVSAKDHSESEDTSDNNMDYSEIISRIRRKRHNKRKWEFEAEMLADFGKDPELCMKAVCALWRQQKTEEKFSKATIFSNQRGFSQCDAKRGSELAEFLIDGDPQSDVVKSCEELLEFNSKGLELCRKLATHYSKQLFAIYENKEDPLFLPS